VEGLFVFECSEPKWKTNQRWIKNNAGNYARFRVRDGVIQVFCDVGFTGARELVASEREGALQSVLYSLKSKQDQSPITTSKAWRLDDNKTGEWNVFQGTGATPEEVRAICQKHGITPQTVQMGDDVKTALEWIMPEWTADREEAFYADVRSGRFK
jgi:hypothetical protein